MSQRAAAIFAFILMLLACVSAWYFFLRAPQKANEPAPTTAPTESTPLEQPTSEAEPSLPETLQEPEYEKVEPQEAYAKPERLMAELAKTLEDGSWEQISNLLGAGQLAPESISQLRELIETQGFRLSEDAFQEVGESRVNRSARWSLNVESPEKKRIFLDLERNEKGWKIAKITVPQQNEDGEVDEMSDALGVADAFLQNVLKLRFEKALNYADVSAVSDAKVAGLCILFEEGGYELRKRKALRAVYIREKNAGFLANVQTVEGEHTAQFGLNLKKENKENGKWKVVDIVLDSLLEDYAKRVQSGDTYYSPLVKNPKGGETLVIYFDFDTEQLTDRMKRQLDIMSTVLKMDEKRKINLTGHADALGSDEYNAQLSQKRASAVKEYLTERGVEEAQIVTAAEGEASPRRPNVREDGTDDPNARRVNRRTEIYLDF